MNSAQEIHVDQEVRIRLLEEISKDNKNSIIRFENELKEIRKDLHNEIGSLKKEMNSQFRWTIGTIFSLFGTACLSFIISIVLHIMKLI